VAEQDWFVVGLLVGLLVGVPIGWLIAQVLMKLPAAHAAASVVFDRDEQGRITAIHYVSGPGGGGAG
jgi:ABC-type antimicrobial peptide transport system permease subunit